MTVETFGGRVLWVMRPQSLATDNRATNLEKKLVVAEDAETRRKLVEYCVLLSCTERIEFKLDGRERPAVIDFKHFIERYETLTPAEFTAEALSIPYALRGAWRDAFSDASDSMFDAPPEQLPLRALTPAQQAEAADPNSPLPSRGA